VQLQQALRSARFDSRHVADAIGAEGPGLTPSPGQVPGLVRALPLGDPLSTMIRLFVATVPVALDDAAAALAPLDLDAAESIGVLAVDGSQAAPLVRLVPVGPLLVACDLTPDPSRLARDVVIGVSSTSWALAHLTARRPVAVALDVGTGCGIQAMLAARHSGRVIGTDVNARAVEFARFNAALNDLANVEVREGDLFEAVDGDRADLVVANPPFVVSPDDDYHYRDGGWPRDELSRHVVREAGARLRPGGLAHVLVGWVHHPGGDWSDPLREWVDGLGCDAWLLHFESVDAEEYAIRWHQPLQGDPERYGEAIGRWLDHFADERIDAIGYGAVVLRRRAGDSGNWVRAESVGSPPVGPAGEQVARLFAAVDDVAGRGEAILDQRLTLGDSLRLEQVLRPVEGDFAIEQATLHVDDGLPFSIDVDAFLADLLAHLDGAHTLGDALDELTAGDGALRAVAIELVAHLVTLGFLSARGS
jgi:methylase of polypeptide subunit release factors